MPKATSSVTAANAVAPAYEEAMAELLRNPQQLSDALRKARAAAASVKRRKM